MFKYLSIIEYQSEKTNQKKLDISFRKDDY